MMCCADLRGGNGRASLTAEPNRLGWEKQASRKLRCVRAANGDSRVGLSFSCFRERGPPLSADDQRYHGELVLTRPPTRARTRVRCARRALTACKALSDGTDSSQSRARRARALGNGVATAVRLQFQWDSQHTCSHQGVSHGGRHHQASCAGRAGIALGSGGANTKLSTARRSRGQRHRHHCARRAPGAGNRRWDLTWSRLRHSERRV